MLRLKMLIGFGAAALAISALLITKGKSMPAPDNPPAKPSSVEKATFGAGCFWCSEAVFLQLKGVKSVVSGYSGGSAKNPTYQQVCDGTTGHAEVIQVTYDPSVITFPELLEVFWQTHDPTTKNRQGNDIGSQYRSAIFYHSDEQRRLAEEYKRSSTRRALSAPIGDGNHGVQRALPRRGLPPELFRAQPEPGVLQRRHSAEARQAEESLCGQTQDRPAEVTPKIARKAARAA